MAGLCDVPDAMGDADDRLAVVGHLAEQLHHFAVRLFVQARGDFVQENQTRVADGFIHPTGPFPLASAELPDAGGTVLRQAHRIEHGGNAVLDLRPGHVAGQPQPGGVAEGRVQRQHVVQRLFLRHHGEVLLQGLELRVEVFAVQQHAAFIRRPAGAERGQQRGLAAAAGSQDADQFPRPYYQRNAVQDQLRAAAMFVIRNAADQVLCDQLRLALVRQRTECRARKDQGIGTDLDFAAFVDQLGLAHPLTIHKRAIGALQITDGRHIALPRDPGVDARHPDVRQAEVGAPGVASDQHLPGRQFEGAGNSGGPR